MFFLSLLIRFLDVWVLLDFLALFLQKYTIIDRNNDEELRPSKMKGIAFQEAKYGAIAAISSLW